MPLPESKTHAKAHRTWNDIKVLRTDGQTENGISSRRHVKRESGGRKIETGGKGNPTNGYHLLLESLR